MKAELSNFIVLFLNVTMIHIPILSPALCAEFNLIQKPLSGERHFSPVLKERCQILARLPHPPKALSHVLTHSSSYLFPPLTKKVLCIFQHRLER